MRRLRVTVLHLSAPENATLSYQHGWPEAIARHTRFDATLVNVARRRDRAALGLGRVLERADAIVVLHSVFANTLFISEPLVRRLARARPPKAFLPGNEYKLMPAKVAFAERIGVALLVSQLDAPEAHELYRRRLGCAVVGIPNTGFDPALFRPRRPRRERPIDLGYRAFPSPPYLGHDERADLARRVAEAAAVRGLATDISLDPADRFDQEGWADFLDRCRGQIGSEAGGDYFELTDETRDAWNRGEIAGPPGTSDEVWAAYWAGRDRPPSGRALSGRIVEAAATKTVQILLEGRYGGYFQPDVHYLPLRKDFANLEEVLDRFADDAECARIADAAYEVARSELTYERLCDRLYDALLSIVVP